MSPSSQQAFSQASDRSVSPEITLSLSTTPSKLVKAARQFEVEKNNAIAEACALRRKLGDITNLNDFSDSDSEEPPPKKSRSSRDEDPDSDDDTSGSKEERIMHAGHGFALLKGLWLRNGARLFYTSYDETWDEAQRFENNSNKSQGQLHELMEVLGRDFAPHDWVAKAFVKGMKAQRSNTATRLRHHCALLFGVQERDMLRPDIRKERFRQRIGWVVNDQGIGSYSSVDVEVLHKNYSGSFDLNTVFRNPILKYVFVALIRGPTAAKEMMHGMPSYDPKTETMARKHGIRHITPGAIAGAAILTRWALSPDEFLQSVGNNTGINYAKDFDEYLELLLVGLRKRKKSTLDLFREWDRIVFPNSDSSMVGQEQSETSSGLKAAMEMLEADEVEEDRSDRQTEAGGTPEAEDGSGAEEGGKAQGEESEGETA